MNKSAKKMFEELGFECHDDRELSGLPLSINYVKLNEYTLNEYCLYISFILPDHCWRTNIDNVSKNDYLMKAIHQQLKELGWFNEL